jgi:Spy/CpxP family protein refolding chaperone
MNLRTGVLLGAIISAGIILNGCAKPTAEERLNRMVDRIAQRLDLTADQKTNLMQIKDNFVHNMRAQKNDREQVIEDLIGIVKSDTLDTNKLDEIGKKVTELNREVGKPLMGSLIEFHKTLSPAQKEKIADWLKDIEKRMNDLM